MLGERLRRFTDGQSCVRIWRMHRGVSPGHFLSLCTCDSESTQLAGVDYTSGLFHGTRSLVSFVATRSERLAFSRGLFFYVLMHSSFRRRLRKRPPETANHSYQSIRKKTRVCFVRIHVHRNVVRGCNRVGNIDMYVACPRLTIRGIERVL